MAVVVVVRLVVVCDYLTCFLLYVCVLMSENALVELIISLLFAKYYISLVMPKVAF